MLTLSYAGRAVVLSFGVFFLANAVVGFLCAAAARWRGFDRMEARQASRLLLTLRLLPAVVAVAMTAVVLFPGFLALERQMGEEAVRVWIVLFALAGFAGWIKSIARTLRALFVARRWSPAGVLETSEPFLAVAGILRPRIIVSRGFLETIPEEQQAVAFRHELAHFEYGDNLKKLFILLAPAVVPLADLFHKGVEEAWIRYAERAADDWAVAGNPERAVLLAEVLVRTARGGSAGHPELAVGLIGSAEGLKGRIERLIHQPDDVRGMRLLPAFLLAMLTALPLSVFLLPAGPLFELVERVLLHA